MGVLSFHTFLLADALIWSDFIMILLIAYDHK